MEAQASMFTTQGNIWMAQMQSSLPMNGAAAKENTSRLSMFLYRGLAMSYELSTYIKNAFGLFTLAKEGGVTAKKLAVLCQLANLLMTIRETLHDRASTLTNVHSMCCESIAFNVQC